MGNSNVSIQALITGREKGGYISGVIQDFQNVTRGQYDITEIVLNDGTAQGKLAVFNCSLQLQVGLTLCASGVYTKEYKGEYSMAVSKAGKVWIDKAVPPQATPNLLDQAIASVAPAQAWSAPQAQAPAPWPAPRAAPVQAPIPALAPAPAGLSNDAYFLGVSQIKELLTTLAKDRLDKDTFNNGIAQLTLGLQAIYEETLAMKIAVLDQLKEVLKAQNEDLGTFPEE